MLLAEDPNTEPRETRLAELVQSKAGLELKGQVLDTNATKIQSLKKHKAKRKAI